MRLGVTQSNLLSDMPQLPKGWVWTTTSEASAYVTDGTHDTPKYVKEGVALVTSKNLKADGLDFVSCRNISPEDHIKISVRSGVENGDLLFAMIGTIGNPVVVQTKRAFSIKNVALFRKNKSVVESEYLKFWLESPFFNKVLETKNLLKGTTQKFIPLEHLRILPVPLSPLKEQHRIVVKVEELSTKLDAGVQSLERVKTQLKQYRQSVLKSAFEGRLTEEWRRTHQDELEPASKFLERVRHERRKKWEQDLRDRGRDPKKYKHMESKSFDAKTLPFLPNYWTWSSIRDIAEDSKHALKAGPFGSSLRKQFYVSHGYKIYGQEQVIRGDPFYGDYYIDEKRYESLKSCSVKPGDILISLVGTMGKVLVLPDGIKPGIINPRLVKISPDKRVVKAEYIKHYLNSPNVNSYYSSVSHGETMDILNLAILEELPIPLSPLSEQQKIVDEIERRLSIADEVEKTVINSSRQTEKLRQSVLKRAFEGKLVPQDSSDEPARLLLERMEALKTQVTQSQNEGKRKKTLKQKEASVGG
jgi:type I restriction enzyme S subunit